jgi:hypothetical protein
MVLYFIYFFRLNFEVNHGVLELTYDKDNDESN